MIAFAGTHAEDELLVRALAEPRQARARGRGREEGGLHPPVRPKQHDIRIFDYLNTTRAEGGSKAPLRRARASPAERVDAPPEYIPHIYYNYNYEISEKTWDVRCGRGARGAAPRV